MSERACETLNLLCRRRHRHRSSQSRVTLDRRRFASREGERERDGGRERAAATFFRPQKSSVERTDGRTDMAAAEEEEEEEEQLPLFCSFALLSRRGSRRAISHSMPSAQRLMIIPFPSCILPLSVRGAPQFELNTRTWVCSPPLSALRRPFRACIIPFE